MQTAADPWRLSYHVLPRAGWMNDPNGFVYFNGEYHLFYQHHPYSSKWDDMHWGHVKSADLIHWEGLPVALAPSEAYDQDGCFSGSAIAKNGKLHLMYTGNVWTGPNRDTDLLQVQSLAASEDGINFAKLPGNPVIGSAPEGIAHPNHFRDPKVWERDGVYYCVLGSRTEAHVGQVLLYRSDNLTDWSFVGVMTGGADRLRDGFMWECPDLFALGDSDILMMSPQGMEPRGELYRNLHQAGCMVGHLDYDTGVFEHGEFRMLDHGFDFYAPQSALSPDGRRIVIGWMAMWESPMPEQDRGWAGAMTLPRELALEGGILRSRPARELLQLRGKLTEYIGVVVDSGTEVELPGIEGDCGELELELDVSRTETSGVRLRVGDAAGESTELRIESRGSAIVLDRERAGAGPGGERRLLLEPPSNGLLTLRIYLDRSSVEVFVQDGEAVMTARIYPGENSRGIRFFAGEGVLNIVRARHWELHRRDGCMEGVKYGE